MTEKSLNVTLQPCNYQLSKIIVHDGDLASCHVINNLLNSDRCFNTEWQFEMSKRYKANGHDTCLVYISKYVCLIISVTYVVGSHWNCLIANNTGAEQPEHPRSLISAFVIRIIEGFICKLAAGEISIF